MAFLFNFGGGQTKPDPNTWLIGKLSNININEEELKLQRYQGGDINCVHGLYCDTALLNTLVQKSFENGYNGDVLTVADKMDGFTWFKTLSGVLTVYYYATGKLTKTGNSITFDPPHQLQLPAKYQYLGTKLAEVDDYIRTLKRDQNIIQTMLRNINDLKEGSATTTRLMQLIQQWSRYLNNTNRQPWSAWISDSVFATLDQSELGNWINNKCEFIENLLKTANLERGTQQTLSELVEFLQYWKITPSDSFKQSLFAQNSIESCDEWVRNNEYYTTTLQSFLPRLQDNSLSANIRAMTQQLDATNAYVNVYLNTVWNQKYLTGMRNNPVQPLLDLISTINQYMNTTSLFTLFRAQEYNLQLMINYVDKLNKTVTDPAYLDIVTAQSRLAERQRQEEAKQQLLLAEQQGIIASQEIARLAEQKARDTERDRYLTLFDTYPLSTRTLMKLKQQKYLEDEDYRSRADIVVATWAFATEQKLTVEQQELINRFYTSSLQGVMMDILTIEVKIKDALGQRFSSNQLLKDIEELLKKFMDAESTDALLDSPTGKTLVNHLAFMNSLLLNGTDNTSYISPQICYVQEIRACYHQIYQVSQRLMDEFTRTFNCSVKDWFSNRESPPLDMLIADMAAYDLISPSHNAYCKIIPTRPDSLIYNGLTKATKANLTLLQTIPRKFLWQSLVVAYNVQPHDHDGKYDNGSDAGDQSKQSTVFYDVNNIPLRLALDLDALMEQRTLEITQASLPNMINIYKSTQDTYEKRIDYIKTQLTRLCTEFANALITIEFSRLVQHIEKLIGIVNAAKDRLPTDHVIPILNHKYRLIFNYIKMRLEKIRDTIIPIDIENNDLVQKLWDATVEGFNVQIPLPEDERPSYNASWSWSQDNQTWTQEVTNRFTYFVPPIVESQDTTEETLRLENRLIDSKQLRSFTLEQVQDDPEYALYINYPLQKFTSNKVFMFKRPDGSTSCFWKPPLELLRKLFPVSFTLTCKPGETMLYDYLNGAQTVAMGKQLTPILQTNDLPWTQGGTVARLTEDESDTFSDMLKSLSLLVDGHRFVYDARIKHVRDLPNDDAKALLDKNRHSLLIRPSNLPLFLDFALCDNQGFIYIWQVPPAPNRCGSEQELRTFWPTVVNSLVQNPLIPYLKNLPEEAKAMVSSTAPIILIQQNDIETKLENAKSLFATFPSITYVPWIMALTLDDVRNPDYVNFKRTGRVKLYDRAGQSVDVSDSNYFLTETNYSAAVPGDATKKAWEVFAKSWWNKLKS